MKNSVDSSLSFRAKYIGSGKISKLDQNSGLFKRINAAFVELEPNNQGDIDALEQVAIYWVRAKYATTISNTFLNKNEISKVYALTSQVGNYEKLNSDDILGLVEISDFSPAGITVDHIQANLEEIYKINREYKGLGTAMLDSLKQIYNKISLTSTNEKSAKNFYRKNNFTEIPENSRHFVWYRDIFDMFRI